MQELAGRGCIGYSDAAVCAELQAAVSVLLIYQHTFHQREVNCIQFSVSVHIAGIPVGQRSFAKRNMRPEIYRMTRNALNV